MTDWGGMRTIVDSRLDPVERADCPVCGTVLESNGSYWTCPFGGRKHWYSQQLPKD